MAKLYDLAVAVGTYTDASGETKKRWKNVGSVVEARTGGQVVLLDRTFCPAGVPVEEGRDQIMLGMFDPKESGGGRGQHREKSPQQRPEPKQAAADLNDDIPF
jgi:hypothetical protein